MKHLRVNIPVVAATVDLEELDLPFKDQFLRLTGATDQLTMHLSTFLGSLYKHRKRWTRVTAELLVSAGTLLDAMLRSHVTTDSLQAVKSNGVPFASRSEDLCEAVALGNMSL